MSEIGPHFLRAAADRDLALASTALGGSLLAMLLHKGVLSPVEGTFVAASAALACRAQGEERAADLIEALVPSCVGVDVDRMAGQLGMEMEKVQVQ